MRPGPALVAVGLIILLSRSVSARPAVADRDGDGIPGNWEADHGASDRDASDAFLDFDDDGLANFAEFLTNGRPWGRYEVLRFEPGELAKCLPDSQVRSVGIIAANRPGEVLLAVTTEASRVSVRWNPPGGVVAGPVFTVLPVALESGVSFSDDGHVLCGGVICNVRDPDAPAVLVNAADGEIPLALADNGDVLMRRDSTGPVRGTAGCWRNYQWRGPDRASEILTFALYPDMIGTALDPVADPGGSAWFPGWFGSGGRDRRRLRFPGFSLAAGVSPVDLPPFPKSWTAVGFHAAAAGRAVGAARDALGREFAVILDNRGWHSLTSPGTTPSLVAVADSGLAVGWDMAESPPRPILWKDRMAPLAAAIPEFPPEFVPVGLTRSGSILAMDHGRQSAIPLPVVLRPTRSALGDASRPNAAPDRDRDGIPDAHESAAGLRPDKFDSDGDGWGDLHELTRRPGRSGPLNATSNPAGLAVLTPRTHPLLTIRRRP